MNTFNKVKNAVCNSKVAKATATGVAAMGTSMTTFAVDHSTAITAATADGSTNVTAAVVGIVALAAVVCGVGFVIKLLGR